MKKQLLPILVATVSLLAAPRLEASALPKSQITGDAKWVMHLDMERFAPSQTCRLLASGRNGGKSFQVLLNRYRTLLGIDPLKDIAGLTLYGTEVTGNRGTALISGALNPQAITRQLSSYPKYEVRTYGKLKLQSWIDRATGRPLWACFYTTRLLILASDESAVLSAAATLDGSRASLATGTSLALPLKTLRDGCFFTAVSRGYAGAPGEDPVKAMILRSTESAVMQLSETSGMVDGSILLRAVSPDTALQIHQVLKGLMVAANLSDEASPLARLAGMSDISRNDQVVTMKLRCPASDAADLLSTSIPST